MGTVQVFTKARMQAIEDGTVTTGLVDVDGNLILTRHDGSHVNAGQVQSQPVMSVTDSATVDLELSGTGTTFDPWNIKAESKRPTSKLMQLAPDYTGPGAAFVTDIGPGLGTQYGPYEWEGSFEANGNPTVRVETKLDGTSVIMGHVPGNPIGGWQRIPTTPGLFASYSSAVGGGWEPLEGAAISAVKTSVGIVALRGLIYTTAVLPNQQIIATLPQSMWPDSDMIFTANQSDVAVTIYVKADGTVRIGGTSVVGQYISLGNVVYPAKDVATWTTMTGLLNGWVDYASTFGSPRYWIDPYGIVWFAGLIKSGNIAASTPIWNIPPSFNSGLNEQQHVITSSNATYGALRFTNVAGVASTLDVLTASSAWISLCGISYITSQALANLTWHPPEFYAGSWANYSATPNGNSQMAWAKRPDGLVMTKGLIKSGNLGSVAMYLPKRAVAVGRALYQCVSSVGRGRLDTYSIESTNVSQGVAPTQGSNGYFSMDNIKWVAGGI